MPPSVPRIVVCGAGVIGAAVAYSLAVRGARPLVVDLGPSRRGGLGEGVGFPRSGLERGHAAGRPQPGELRHAPRARRRARARADRLPAHGRPDGRGRRREGPRALPAPAEPGLARRQRRRPRGHRDAGDDRTGEPPRLHHGADRGGRRARGDPGHRGCSRAGARRAGRGGERRLDRREDAAGRGRGAGARPLDEPGTAVARPAPGARHPDGQRHPARRGAGPGGLQRVR